MSDNFENIVKQKLEGLEIEPRAGLFGDIINKRKKKKRAAWIWSSAAAILIVSGLAFYINHTNVKTVSIDKATDYENSTVREVESVEPALPEILSYTDNTTAPEYLTENSTKSIQETENIGNQTLPQFIPPIAKTEEIDTKEEDNQIQNEELANLYKKLVNESEDIISGKEGTFYLKDLELKLDRKPLKIKSTLNKDVHLDKDNSIESEGAVESNVVKTNTSNDDPDLVGISDKPSKFGLEIGAGIGRNSALYTGDQLLSNRRKANEQNKFSNNIDLRGYYRVGNNLNLKSGILFNRISDDFKYKFDDEISIKTRTESKPIYVVHPVLGSFIAGYEEVTITDTTTTPGLFVQNENTYTSFSIPIGIEKAYFIGDKFKMLPQAGLLFGINQQVKGNYVDLTNELQSLSNEEYRTRAFSQIELGLGLAYSVSDNFDIYAQPRFTSDLNSRLRASGLKKYNFAYTLNLGLRMEL